MASSTKTAATKAPKVVQLLDPTTLASSHAVRFPKTNGRLIQGKFRFPNSKAAINFAKAESRKLKTALQHLTNGNNIFAYNNIRTNQVIYSLSRNLDYKNVASQLVYHGKKTVPASLRKDMWTPYFSVHFASKTIGLEAYKLLRQFSLRRQLEPPAEMITNSDRNIGRRRPRDPIEAEKWDKIWRPRMGQFMTKKDRARTLMDQKATSVADVAAVLAIQAEREQNATEEDGEGVSEEGGEEGKEKALSNKAKRRQQWAVKQAQKFEETVQNRIVDLEQSMTGTNGARVKIDTTGETADYKVSDGQIWVLWTDLQDAQFAREWPQSVQHGELVSTPAHTISPYRRESDTPVAPSPSVPQEQPTIPEAAAEESEKNGMDRLKFWKS